MKTTIQYSKSLLQAVEGLLKFANIAGFEGIRKTCWSMHKNLLLEDTIEESFSDINLFVVNFERW